MAELKAARIERLAKICRIGIEYADGKLTYFQFAEKIVAEINQEDVKEFNENKEQKDQLFTGYSFEIGLGHNI